MKGYYQGDIVKVNYPFSDKNSQLKQRPVLIISNAKLNIPKFNEIIVLPITSINVEDDFLFFLEDDMLTINLPKNSQVRCQHLLTIHKEDVISFICKFRNKVALEMLLKKVSSIIQLE